jgi:hypothetical protein
MQKFLSWVAEGSAVSLKPRRILSVLAVTALLAGLFVTSAYADNGRVDPPLDQYLSILGSSPFIVVNGATAWAHFDRGELVYGFPSDVTGLAQGYDQDWKTAPPVNGQDWETANANDASEAPSDNSSWQNGIAGGLQNSGGHSGQEPRYLGFNSSRQPISNINFPPDTSGLPDPGQCQLVKQPWDNVPADPDYGNKTGGWPQDATTTIAPYAWGVIMNAIQTCNDSFGYPGRANSFTANPAFKTGMTETAVENYFELLVQPEPGITGSVRFWNISNGSDYYKTIDVPWPLTPLPNYYVTNITPFSGTQPPNSTQTVNGQTAAVYNKSGTQYTYTGTVTFGTEPDGMTVQNAGELTDQLWNLVDANDDDTNAPPAGGYYAPVGVCINSQDNFATITDGSNFQPVLADEDAGGPQAGEGTVLQATGSGTYTATFTWSVPQNFSGASIPIAAGINDGWNDYLNQTVDIMPEDITDWYADLGEFDLSDNFTTSLVDDASNGSDGSGSSGTTTNVPVVGAATPQLVVTPATATIQTGGAQQYTDTYYPDGQSQGGGQIVTTQSTWSDDNSSIATIVASSGLATGAAQGSTNIEAGYAPPGGSALTGTASLAVQGQQRQPANGYAGSLAFEAVNMDGLKTLLGQAIGGTLHRKANTAMWTDTVTATLTVPAPPEPEAMVQSDEAGTTRNFQVTGWQVTMAALTYPEMNPNFSFGNPVEPVSTASTGMAPGSSGTATASFQENWSEDGIGYGRSGPDGVHDALTGQTMAASPRPYNLSATFTVDYTYTYEEWKCIGTDAEGRPVYAWVPENGSGTIGGAAGATLTVDGAGAMPITGQGDASANSQLFMVGSTLNPQ